MLSVRTSSVHERQAETIHPKNRLTARLGSFIVQRKNKTGFANHTIPAQTNPISSKLSNSPNCGSQIKRRSTKLKAFVRQSKEKFGENLQSLTTFKRQTSVDTKNLDFSATTTTPKKTTIKPKPSFILGELNNFRKPPTVQVSWRYFLQNTNTQQSLCVTLDKKLQQDDVHPPRIWYQIVLTSLLKDTTWF